MILEILYEDEDTLFAYSDETPVSYFVIVRCSVIKPLAGTRHAESPLDIRVERTFSVPWPRRHH